MKIRKALETDLNDVLEVERLAFGYDKEAELVRALLQDPSAEPLLSLLPDSCHRIMIRMAQLLVSLLPCLQAMWLLLQH